jgi:hypothetical protein
LLFIDKRKNANEDHTMEIASESCADDGRDAAWSTGTTKRKRLDVSARLEARQSSRESVVKCCLAARIRRQELRPHIDALVEAVSSATHKASLVFNRMLLHCLDRGTNLPPLTGLSAQNTYIHCFLVTSGPLAANITSQVLTTWKLFFDPLNWPTTRVKGDANALVYAAKRYQTAFSNSCIFAFDGRQKAHVRSWLTRCALPVDAAWPVLCAINGWSCRTPLPTSPAIAEFVNAERTVLGLGAGGVCNEAWRKANLESVVRYYHHILRVKDVEGAVEADTADGEGHVWGRRGFTLAPVCKIKRHFVTIDARVLQALMRSSGDTTAYDAGDDKKWTLLWASAFQDIASLRKQGVQAPTIETDGVALCVHFRFRGERQKTKQSKKRSRATPTTASSPASSSASASVDPTRRALPPDVIALDPGRRTLLYGVRETSQGLKRHRLTKGEFYSRIGKARSDQRIKGWLKAEIEAQASAVSADGADSADVASLTPKTTDAGAWGTFLAAVRAALEPMTANRHAKKWSRDRLRTWIAKHRVVDGFFLSLKAATGGRVPHLAWGDASFAASARGGGLAAPTTFLQKRAVATLGAGCVTPVDEFRTSKCCASCGAVLQAVTARKTCKDGVERWCEVRGLRRCDSTDCHSFVDRDDNAARNILKVFKGMCAHGASSPLHRPNELRRDCEASAGPMGRFRLAQAVLSMPSGAA